MILIRHGEKSTQSGTVIIVLRSVRRKKESYANVAKVKGRKRKCMRITYSGCVTILLMKTGLAKDLQR